MGETIKDAAVCGKQNEGSIEAEVIYEGASVAAELFPKKR